MLKNNKGHTLIELMISLTLSLCLIGLCLSAFLFMHKAWLQQHARVYIQENAIILYHIFDNDMSSIERYTIDFTGRKHPNGTAIKALYTMDKYGRRIELVEGVETMIVTQQDTAHPKITLLLSSSGFLDAPIQQRWWTYAFQTKASEEQK